MNDPVSGPQPGDWFMATARGLHPVRVVLCFAGIALTVLFLAAAEALFAGRPIDWDGWWLQPIQQALTFRGEMAERTFFRAAVRVLPLIGVVTAVWCLFGCWIARHELLARTRNQAYDTPEPLHPGPTSLVTRKFKDLVVCCPTALALLALSSFPVILAGILNDWFGGVGALLVGVILPVVLIADLVLLCLALGFLAWPLMPMAIAAENSDTFDALSRCYNYAFTRPIRLVFFNAMAVGVASVPILVVLFPLADVVAGLQPPGSQVVFWLAVAISTSIFWSLQTLVYLHMRRAVDDVDANEIATRSAVDEPAEPKSDSSLADVARKAAESEPKPSGSFIKRNLLGVIAVLAAWWLTVWLFAKLGGDETGWMNWVLGDEIVPAAKGLYAAAALLALIWGVMWLGLPIYMAIRSVFRSPTEEVQPVPPASESPTSP